MGNVVFPLEDRTPMQCEQCLDEIENDDAVIYTNWEARIVFHQGCYQ